MPLSFFLKYGAAMLLISGYLLYTMRFSRKLNKSNLFSKNIRKIHAVMIWLIPFIWIFLLENITKPTPGSLKISKKEEDQSFSNPYPGP